MRLSLFGGRGRGQYILTFSQAPDGESNHVNHAEPELFSQRLHEMKV
jgi:hypothetical protein